MLAANAATSFTVGVAGLLAAPWWSHTLGIGSVGWIRIVSAALLLFAFEVAMIAYRPPARLAAATATISLADIAWVGASIVVLLAAELTTTGRVIAVIQGIGVLDFALLQLWLRSRLD